MADRMYLEKRTCTDDGVMHSSNVKLLDNGDGTHSIATRQPGLSKQMVSGANGVSIPATEFWGVSVVTLLASATAKFYDAASATGDPFMQKATSAIADWILPVPIKLTTGLYVQPSAASTAKFWVYYR